MPSYRFACLVAFVCCVSCAGGGGGTGAGSSPATAMPTASATAPGATATPTASATPTTAAMSVDCSAATNRCPTLVIAGESPAPGGFHGYADPDMRRDPSSGVEELAYSWPRTAADGSHVVDLHLAHSDDGGASFVYDGALYTSSSVTNSTSAAYAKANDSSTETIDLLPIAQGNATLWLQAHWSYLVASGSKDIYGQAYATNYVSLTALTVPVGSPPSALLGLGSAPEARLGTVATDANFNPNVDLSMLNVAVQHCGQFQQPALFDRSGMLYLGLQCFEQTPSGDGSSTAYFLFDTQPAGADPAQWTWSYVGKFATPAQAVALGNREGTPYQFFTELQFVTGRNGGLEAIVSPAIVSTTGQQPAIQYGCRAIPIASLAPPTLQTDANGAPVVLAAVTENDLETSPNEGPGSCTYDAGSTSGIVLARKLEADPVLGFYQALQSSGLHP